MKRLFLRLALLYARLVPFPQRKWRICLFLLGLGGIHPWRHREAWRRVTAGMPPVVVPIRGVRLWCEWDDSADLPFLLVRDHQPYETNVLERLIRSGDAIVDGGANVGFYTLLFALRAGPRGRIWAYEPVSQAADKLRRNLTENRDLPLAEIVFRQAGLSDASKRVPIYLRPSGSGADTQHSSIVAGFNTPADEARAEEIEVVRLDDEPIDRRLDLVKCDLEGAELAFLAGARKRLAADRPLMVLEWNPAPETYGADEILDLLAEIGDYAVYPMRHGRLAPATRDELRGFRGDVVCATPEHRADRLRGLL